MQLNPGWNGSSVDVLWGRAAGPGDTLHYVWSSLGAPAVLLVATAGGASALPIDWPRLLSPSPAGAIRIDPPSSVLYSGAIVFSKVFEQSEAGAGQEIFYPPYDLSEFSWDSLNHTLNHSALTAELRGGPSMDPGGTFSNGSLSFRVTAYEAGGRDQPLPSLLHTPNSSKVEFVLAGVAPRANTSRFLLEVAAVQGEGVAQTLLSSRSIDDEFTPTIFEMLSLVAESQNLSSPLSFLQWKGTAYGSPRPRRQDGIRCQAGGLREPTWTLPPSSIVRAYFGEGGGTSYSIRALNISFGGEDEHVYQERRYLSWSALVGFGQPPRDTFSPLVISIMAVALGTPALILLLGSCLVLLAQRRRYSEYEPIN
ncbi:GLMPB protein, partial [Brachypteracias leptosomus]|nr:GLMPB protein [Brachypteracias leptosomus]